MTLAPLAAVILLAGCSALIREPYHPREKFDLSVPENPQRMDEQRQNVLKVKSFRNLSPAGRKIQYHDTDGSIRDIAGADWAQEPERMLLCAVTGYFAGAELPQNVAKCEISGSIWQFSLDKVSKKGYLGVSYAIKVLYRDGRISDFTGTVKCDAPWAAENGSGAAAAMNKCVVQFAHALDKELTNLK